MRMFFFITALIALAIGGATTAQAKMVPITRPDVARALCTRAVLNSSHVPPRGHLKATIDLCTNVVTRSKKASGKLVDSSVLSWLSRYPKH